MRSWSVLCIATALCLSACATPSTPPSAAIPSQMGARKHELPLVVRVACPDRLDPLKARRWARSRNPLRRGAAVPHVPARGDGGVAMTAPWLPSHP